MKLTRRELGKAAAVAVLAPAALAQTGAQSVPDAQRNWRWPEARASHAAAAGAIARVQVPMAVEPATRFQA